MADQVMFRTLDQTPTSTASACSLRVDLNVPMRERQGHRRDPHRAHGADHHRDRRQGRQGDPARAFRPAEGTRSQGIARSRSPPRWRSVLERPVAFAEDCIGADGRGRGRRDEARRHPAAWRTPASTTARRRTIRPSSRELAKLGDLWVNDAFSAAHRAHASTEGLGHKLPAYAGRTMQAELDALAKALDAPQRPVAAIVGGAKVSTKLDLLGNLIAKVDVLIIGGAMANTFLAAQGKAVGKSLCEHDLAADRARHPGQGEGARLRDRAAGRRRGGARSSRPTRPRASWRRRRRRRRDDPRHRPAQHRACRSPCWRG